MESENIGFEAKMSQLKELAMDNKQFFQEESHRDDKMVQTLLTTLENIEPAGMLYEYIALEAPFYDFDENTQANGYRSLLRFMEIIVDQNINLNQEIRTARSSLFFRKETFLSKMTAMSEGFKTFRLFFKLSEYLITISKPSRCHFPEEDKFVSLVTGLDEHINQYAFYSHLLGFQFCDSMAMIFKPLLILMASFSEFYYGSGTGITDILRSGKYLVDPDRRAKRIVNISQYASPLFCKHFWYLGEMELMVRVPSLIHYTTFAINKEIIVTTPPLTMTNVRGEKVEIPAPSAHLGEKPIHLRLLSASKRYGPAGSSWYSGSKYPSRELIFHCHGGGFISQSPRSHETYLKQWAIDIDCPIISLDYSLAPEAPYPRAIEEAFYAYCWTLENFHLLGSTGERIVLAGDSAGANINFAILLQCYRYGIRPPDGAFFAYVPVVMNFKPTPSRLLSMVDPLLPLGFLIGCIKAYTCSSEVFWKSTENEYKLRTTRETTQIQISSKENSKNNSSPVTNGNAADTPKILGEGRTEQGLWAKLLSTFTSAFKYQNPNSTVTKKSAEEVAEEMKNEEFLPIRHEQLDFVIPHDPLMSPYYTPDEILQQYPPIALITTESDPFLDDCIIMAKKLKSLGNKVDFVALKGLPHGFLNFTLASKEATEGCKRCCEMLKSLLRADCVSAEECK